MREVLFKNLTSQDAHKRILIMSEIVSQGDIVIKTHRRSTYLIRDCIRVKDPSDLNNLKELDKKNESQKRHFYIIKKHDSKTGEDKLFCKVQGLLYVVMGNCVYQIAFVNSFTVGFRKSTFTN